LLILIVPAVLAVELLAAFPKVPRWAIWALRLAIVGSGARILLHGSIYLTDVAGPGTAEWSTTQAWMILGSLAAAEAIIWILLALLARRAPGVSVVACLAAATGVSAVTIMLSGYATGGQAGLPLAAALLGGSAVAAVLPGPARQTAPIGVAVVGLFSLLVMGRFFGELSSTHAIVLFAVLLLAWLPELPRGVVRVLLVGIVASAVLVDAARRFAAESGPATPGSEESSTEDYQELGR
jgi:hypothetical protein